jgi:TRAP-type C4-dicarboxylate transport system permease small subunit
MRLPEAYNSAEKAVNQVSRVTGMVAVGILAIMVLFTVSDVVLRYFFNRPIYGSLEITVFLMVCVGCLGLAWASATGAHVKVDLVVSKYPPRVQQIVDIINYLCVIAVCALIGWRGFRESLATIHYNLSSDTLHVPFYPFYWILVFGYFLMLLVIATLLVRSLRKA